MIIVDGGDCLQAWRNAVNAIGRDGLQVCNLMVEIEDPVRMSNQWLREFNPQSIRPSYDNINDVINTVFPYKLRRRYLNRYDFYTRYSLINKRARKISKNRSAWGTYFQRLTDFSNDGKTNQLDTAISKLNTWNKRSTTGLVFHLSSPHIDKPRTRGGPCWHFGELLWQPSGRLDLVVVYRNHDYFNKALGNFIALGQLLDFICVESNKEPGQLICHSVHAYFGAPKGKMLQLAKLPV